MSDGMLHSFWSSLERAEQRVEAQARDAQRSLYRTLYGYENRVMRLRWALEASGPLARKEIEGKLKKVSLDAVWPILLSVVKDIALYYGGSVVLGTAVGAGVGALFFGAGAIPGAALGFEAGMVLGEWVMMYLGLKMLAEGMIDTIPPAMNCYVEGFRAAWGPTDSDRPDARYLAGYAPSKETAAQRFAQGHVLMIMAILIAIVAYLMRGKSEKALLKAVGDSKRLGSKMADWLEENEKALLKEKELQPKVRARAEEVKEEAPQANASQTSGNTQRARVADSSKSSGDSGTTSTSNIAEKSSSKEPKWLQRIRAGNAFDDAQAANYPHNEVYIDAPEGGYTRLDSYNPNLGEIVSRKYTQLAEVQESTAVKYINEIPAKYPVGATIADVPSSGSLAGATLQGQYILEVPVQANPVPQAVLDAADNAGVIIRDVNGKIY